LTFGKEITVYIPSQFKVNDPESIRLFIEENSFGLLLTISDGEIHDSYTPFALNGSDKETQEPNQK
jgi:predicted FMN-binding regulatory protein PaiB